MLGRMLARSPRLELRGNGIGPAGAAAIAFCPTMSHCTTLDLMGNYLGDVGFAALVGSKNLGNVHTLKLGDNQIADAGLVAVRDTSSSLARLRVFDLSGNRLTRYGLGILEAARGESATALDVSGNVQSATGGEAPVSVGRVVPEDVSG